MTAAAGLAVAVGGFESVGGLESAGAATLVVAVGGLESTGAFESVGVAALALAFTGTFTVLQTVFPLTLVHTFLVVNLVAADAEGAPSVVARERAVAETRATRMMSLR